MEEIKKISTMGYDIGKKAKLHEVELLSLLEMIKYDQYHDFLKRIFEIARKVKVSIQMSYTNMIMILLKNIYMHFGMV